MSDDKKKQDEVVAIVRELLSLKSYGHVIDACTKLVEQYPKEPRLWSILGVALGATGNHEQAGKCFVTVISLNGFQCHVIVNLISASFGSGKPDLACRQIDKYFHRLCDECKGNVLSNVLEALRIGDIDRSSLPAAVALLLNNVEPL